MKYASTRSNTPDVSCVGFREAVLNGLAPDGGLYYPLAIPKLTSEQLDLWRNLPYTQLVVELLSIYSHGEIAQSDLSLIAQRAAKKFSLPEWAQLKPIDSCYILELFHGPSFSFKDYAMCIIGELMDYLLANETDKCQLIVATSGDTGSAAIYGFMDSPHVICHVLFPFERISSIQRRQMTTTQASAVNCYAVKGDFDDCQRLLKEAFNNTSLKKKVKLLAVNSVNFARIVCQMVYYFWSVYRVQDKENNPNLECDFVVPTGNFGNILAGYYAKLMGCKIRRLIIASNVNDILPRTYESGIYKLSQVVPTISPAIDIQVSSNFERLLQHFSGSSVRTIFERLHERGEFEVQESVLSQFRRDFRAFRSSEEETRATCKLLFERSGYLIDPHTSVAYCAAMKYKKSEMTVDCPLIVVSTAHPAKFADDLKTFIDGETIEHLMPEELKRLSSKPESFNSI